MDSSNALDLMKEEMENDDVSLVTKQLDPN